jgi:hypothetical protein
LHGVAQRNRSLSSNALGITIPVLFNAGQASLVIEPDEKRQRQETAGQPSSRAGTTPPHRHQGDDRTHEAGEQDTGVEGAEPERDAECDSTGDQ